MTKENCGKVEKLEYEANTLTEINKFLSGANMSPRIKCRCVGKICEQKSILSAIFSSAIDCIKSSAHWYLRYNLLVPTGDMSLSSMSNNF